MAEIQKIIDGVLSGRTDLLGQAITLVESSRAEDKVAARTVLEACSPHAGNAIRLAISGVPGVGKSTFINAFGQKLLAAGKKVAVLAIDPSSQKSKGSILGDKTRMAELSAMEGAFIRPSPTAGALGGVARNTHEAMLLCEAAGFDVIIIETVGVGQSETAVAQLVDLFVLLVLSGAGDELQGIKRGIMEQADLVVVNKTDQADPGQLKLATQDLKNALHLFPANEKGLTVNVMHCSALTGNSVENVMESVLGKFEKLSRSGALEQFRRKNAVAMMHRILRDRAMELVMERIPKEELPKMALKVQNGEASPYQAVDRLIELAFSAT